MSSEKALARREAEEELIRSTLRRVATKAAETLEGLYKDPKEKGYNRDADKTWAECSMKTRAALVITKATQGQTDQEVGRAFGVIILAGRATSAKDWEEQAREVDEESRKRAAIDVEAVEVKP